MDMDSDQPIFSVKAYSLQFAPQNIHRCNTSNPQYLQSIKSKEYSMYYIYTSGGKVCHGGNINHNLSNPSL